MSRLFAMLMPSPLAMAAAGAEAEDEDEESRLQAGLASRILSGPGLWLDRLEEIDRRGLVEELLAEGIIDQAAWTWASGRPGTTWRLPPSTARRPSCSAMTCSPGEFGVPAGGTKPKARIVAHVRTGSRRWIGAAAVGDVARNGVMPGQLMR